MDNLIRSSATWVLEKHTKSIDDLLFYLKLINDNNGGLSKPDLDDYIKKAKLEKRYVPRKKDSTSTIKNKVGALRSYGFGVLTSDSKFYVGPYGELLIKHFGSKDNIKKIVLSSLWFFQYPHHKLTTEGFSIYPFRLIFKLMRDKKLNYRIYSAEIVYFLMFTKTINQQSYDDLLKLILEFRSLSPKDQEGLFLKENRIGSQSNINNFVKENFSYNDSMIKASEMQWADLTHQVQYYNMSFLEDLGIINSHVILKAKSLAQFSQTLPKAKSTTVRTLKHMYYQGSNELNTFIDDLCREYPFDKDPMPRDVKIEDEFVISSIGTVPNLLKIEIGDTSETMLNEVESYESEPEDLKYLGTQSKNMNDYTRFEKLIALHMDKFKNITAQHLGGSGKTDVECSDSEYKDKFNIDGKTTNKVLSAVNPSRLEQHRKKNGGKFTTIITPYFSKGVLVDIENTKNTIITTQAFDELVRKYTIHDKLVSFGPIRIILEKNLGKDSTPDLSAHLINTFGIKLNY
jgi:hypothetical protein